MLVLTRRPDEIINIGVGADRATITILSVLGNKVRLGIEAPPHILVDREEVSKRRAEELAAQRHDAE